MSRNYRSISEYEKEILELKNKGYTKREIGEKYGFTKEQIHNFISRHNTKQRKVEAGIALRKKGRPAKGRVVTDENFFSILKTECINRVKPKTFHQARLMIDEYIYFYNNQRIQLKTKLTPTEYRSQFAC